MTTHRIIFISETTVYLSEQALAVLLGQARAEHQRAGLTGFLLYHEGRILQVLEGEEMLLHEFFARIARDPRHGKLQILADGPKLRRYFSDWHMSFARTAAAPDAPTNYLPLPELLAIVKDTPVQQLLEEFLAESDVPLR